MGWKEFNGPRRDGVVRAIKNGITLIQCGSEWFMEDTAGIRPMPESARCSHCGEFVCVNCHTPSTSNQPIQMNPVSFSYLATLSAAKTPIECVEGKLTALYPPKEYASGKRQGEQYQNGEITHEGLKVFLKIDAPELILPTSKKGSMIRIESKQGSKGISGLYYEVGEYNGKETRTLKLTATAIISYPGGDSGASEPPSGTTHQNLRPGVPKSDYSPTKGHSGEVANVNIRIRDYFNVVHEVCHRSGKSFEAFLEGLSSSDLKEIGTTIYLSYKEGYVWHDPVFGNVEDGAESKPAMEERSWEGDKSAPKAKVNTWEDFQHPKRGRLGDMPMDIFLKFAAWAKTLVIEGETAQDREAKIFQANVLAGVEAKKLTNKQIFMAYFMASEGVNETFDLDDLEAVLGEQFSKASKNLSEGEWLDSLKHSAKIIAACKTNHADAVSHDDSGGIPD